MALMKLDDKVLVSFDTKTITISRYCSMEEVLVAVLTKQDRRIYDSVLGTSLLEKGIFGNVSPLNHSFSPEQQKHGAPKMRRIILPDGWMVSGANKIMNGKVFINHFDDQDGNNVENIVIEIDNVLALR